MTRVSTDSGVDLPYWEKVLVVVSTKPIPCAYRVVTIVVIVGSPVVHATVTTERFSLNSFRVPRAAIAHDAELLSGGPDEH